ncbi:MAG: hypothetical protein R3E77_11105 [Steroidobacteraceae bacterium]
MIAGLLRVGALQLAVMLVLVARTKGLALWLGPEWLGLMSVIDKLLALFAQTAAFSLPLAAVRFLPAALQNNSGEMTAIWRAMRNWLVLTLALAMATGLALATFSPGLLGAELVGHRDILLVAFASLPAIMFVPFLQNSLSAHGEPTAALTSTLLNALGLTASAFLGVWLAGLRGLYLVYAVFGICFVALSLRRLSRKFNGGVWVGPPRGRFSLPREIWRFVMIMRPLAIAGPFALLFVNYRVLQLEGAAAAGWMQAAFAIAIAASTVLSAGNLAMHTPNVSRGGTPQELMNRAEEYLCASGFLAAVCLPPLLLFPKTVISILYSQEFHPATAVLAIFLIAKLLELAVGAVQAIVIALDHMKFHVVENVLVQLLVIAAAIVLIPRFGITGAALSLALESLCLLLVSTTFLLHRHALQMPTRPLWLWIFLLSAAISCRALAPLPEWQPQPLLLRACLYAAIIGGAFILAPTSLRTQLRSLLRPGRRDSTRS